MSACNSSLPKGQLSQRCCPSFCATFKRCHGVLLKVLKRKAVFIGRGIKQFYSSVLTLLTPHTEAIHNEAHIFMLNSSFSKDSDSSGLKPSPSSVLEFVEDVQTSLHHLASEGDIEGVRLQEFFGYMCCWFSWVAYKFSTHLQVLSDCRNLLARAAAGKAGCSLGTILDSRNEGGLTPLHVAVMRGSLEIVNAILEYAEADIEALDKDGDPPMLFSLACGTTECLKALIARGADVNVRLKEGLGPTIAHMCATYGEPECMQVIMPSISVYLSVHPFAP